ncbi:MAG: PepSY-associated TM helix domain-containing protein [Paludibacteraceae bacterium]
MNFKKIMRKIHLWLALPSAIVLFIVFITGSLFTYTDELLEVFHRPYSQVAVGETKIPVEDIVKGIQSAYPKEKVASLVAYNEPDKSYRFLLFSKENGIRNVFANPYTGAILGESRAHQFFYSLAHLHGELLLGETGGWIVKIATIIMLFLIVSGIVLWLPKKITSKNWVNYFTFGHKHTYKRIAFDHHRVLGFYFAGLLLLLVLTGIVMAFKPLSTSVAVAMGGGKSTVVSDSIQSDKREPLLNVIEKINKQGNVKEMRIALLSREDNGLVKVAAGKEIGILTFNGDVYFVDRVTGELVKNDVEKANAKAENLMMSLHTGNWGGWFGKLTTCLSGLIGAYLIVTGLVIWWNKQFRKKSSRN